jgi:hypothetical protein
VNTKRILIDNRVEMNVAVDPLTENTLYCRPFEEDIHNISTFIVSGQEFVHKYDIGFDNKAYINTDIVTEEGDVYSDVRFKVVIVEKGELPLSVLNIKAIANHSLISEKTLNNDSIDMQHVENIIFEKVEKYKQDLLLEFLSLSQEHQKLVAQYTEQFKALKEKIESIEKMLT